MEKQKKVFIMGDSYSTFRGYNPEGYRCYYGDNRENAPVVGSVEKTWWMRLAKQWDYRIVLNDSYSGSTVCNTVRPDLPLSSSFVNRLDRYMQDGFFRTNEIGLAFIFGGTNDSWLECPIGTLTYSDWTEADLLCVLPAFCYLLHGYTEIAGIPQTVVVINTELKPEIVENMVLACRHYGVDCVKLSGIDKKYGHPTELGMEQIACQLSRHLTNYNGTDVVG